MINVTSKRCCIDGCPIRASFGYEGEQCSHCDAHKLEGMINVVLKPCLYAACTGYANRNCPEQYCMTCYLLLHPNNDLAKRYCAKERKVMGDFRAGLIEQGRADLAEQLIFNKKIAGGESAKRPDCLVSLQTHNVLLEVDENQASYHVDPVRDALLAKDGGGEFKPTAFLRLNPDGYIDSNGNRNQSVFEAVHPGTLLPYVSTERMSDYQRRINAMVKAFIHLCKHRPAEPITVQYLYFDGHCEEEDSTAPSDS
jgi:hypothetical protein